ncbi:MAG TPA: HD domain-containing phosphohydrolase [Gemmatimonadaceae bacterium]|nr:HD domain-containing phosphohydrolase [Gemmatimonadaceae bacterium]
MAELLSLTQQREPDKAKGVDSAAAYLRRRGRDFIISFYGTLRAIKLYPLEHTAVKRSLVELSGIAREIVGRERDLEFRFSGEFIFINTTRLRLDLTNYASFGYLLKICRDAGIGVIRVHDDAGERTWRVFLSLLDSSTETDPDERREKIIGQLADAGLTSLELGPPQEDLNDNEQAEQTKEAANRTYTRSVALTRDVINSVRLGRTPSIKKIKRVVQGIVDQILNEETSLIGLTAIRDYDEYTFTHSVNVCIFSVALGRRLGMTKLQLFDLGISALMHDIGKSRIPVGLLQKSEDLSEDEWLRIAAHPWLGVLVLFNLKGQQEEVSYRAMTVAYEHHMRADLSGYPKVIRPRSPSMASRIVAVADGYDAATSRRSYQTVPYPPSAVLQDMRDNPRRGMDPVVVKAFINLLGIYPPGTLVVLDTFELAVVSAANSGFDALSRPIVKIVSDANGNMVAPPLEVDLAQVDSNGDYPRTIIKTADPDRYGINIGDCIV